MSLIDYIEILKDNLDSVLIGYAENILCLMNSYRYYNTEITINGVDYRIVPYNYHYNVYGLSNSIGGACIYKCNTCVIFASWMNNFCMDASIENSMKGYIECERMDIKLINHIISVIFIYFLYLI